MSERDLSQIYGNIPADSLNGHSTADLSDPKVTNRWTGKVIANKDSMRMGRVKVKCARSDKKTPRRDAYSPSYR